MLHNDWYVRFKHRGINRCRAEWLRIRQIVETQMQRPACRHDNRIGTDRVAVCKEYRECDVGVAAVARVQDAGRLVRDQGALGRHAGGRNIIPQESPTACVR